MIIIDAPSFWLGVLAALVFVVVLSTALTVVLSGHE